MKGKTWLGPLAVGVLAVVAGGCVGLWSNLGLQAAAQGACAFGDPNATPQPGTPYFHHVERAFSGDGIHYTPENVTLLAHASVPDAVLRDDGEIWIYYVNGQPGRHGIWVARPNGDGGWAEYDCVKLDGAFSGRAVDPDVVRLADGRTRLFYFGNFGFPTNGGAPSISKIQSAVSDDGVNFRVEGVLLELEGATDPSGVQLPDGRWLMALAQPQQRRVRVARSDDGGRFELLDFAFENAGIPELALLPDGRVWLFAGSARYSTADAGRSWTFEFRAQPTPEGFLSEVADPSIVKLANTQWVMFHKRFDP